MRIYSQKNKNKRSKWNLLDFLVKFNIKNPIQTKLIKTNYGKKKRRRIKK